MLIWSVLGICLIMYHKAFPFCLFFLFGDTVPVLPASQLCISDWTLLPFLLLGVSSVTSPVLTLSSGSGSRSLARALHFLMLSKSPLIGVLRLWACLPSWIWYSTLTVFCCYWWCYAWLMFWHMVNWQPLGGGCERCFCRYTSPLSHYAVPIVASVTSSMSFE